MIGVQCQKSLLCIDHQKACLIFKHKNTSLDLMFQSSEKLYFSHPLGPVNGSAIPCFTQQHNFLILN